MKKKTIALVLALVLIVGAAIGGTVAYLTDKTASVKNTFTIGKVDIDLTETGAVNNAKSYKMIPGDTLSKDPKVTVTANSEDSWVFVKVVANNVSDYLEYSIDSGWTKLSDDVPGVYYRSYTSSATATDYAVLTNNQVKVKDTVTNELMSQAANNYPTLTFTAYAIQKANFANVADAWAEVSK